jgi:hypothetical protein
MRTLISEVLLPASAAIGLLAMLTIPPATAEDRAPPQEAAVPPDHGTTGTSCRSACRASRRTNCRLRK